MLTSNRTRRSVSLLSRLCPAAALALAPIAASAAGDGFDFSGLKLPPGFTATTYISATGFDPDASAPGLPAIVTITFDSGGNLYFARTANRLREIYGTDRAPIYRLPAGPAKITPAGDSDRRPALEPGVVARPYPSGHVRRSLENGVVAGHDVAAHRRPPRELGGGGTQQHPVTQYVVVVIGHPGLGV